MKVPKVIGLGGTDASGKDTIGELLAERHGWQFISVTEILREEAKRRGISLKRHTLREISAQWRREQGMGVLVEKAIEQHDPKKYKGLVVSSLRNPGEADKVHQLGGQVVWTDAHPHIRYNRVMSRKRGTEDEVSFEEFLTEENTQMKHSGDEATLNLSGVKQRADIFLQNNGDDLKKFEAKAEKALAKFLN